MIGLILASALSEIESHPVVGNTRFEAGLGNHCAERLEKRRSLTSNVENRSGFPSAFDLLDAEIVERDRFHVGALLMTPCVQRRSASLK